MKKLLILFACLPLLGACTQTEPVSGNRAAAIVAEIHNPRSKNVVVASHRGDWRNYPENSIAAIESVIGMGVDIMELDLKLTIRRCVLKTGHGVKTTHRMPTLREALEVCKDRIVVNVDQGYEYYDLVLAVTEELGVTDQILIKGKRSTDAVAAKFAEHPRNMMYMPIIDILKPQGRALFAEYQEKGIAPLAYEVCWNKYTPEVKECMDKVVAGGSKLWVNSLWASLCGGLDDDAAFGGDPAEVYGKLVDMGATMIQTDRPELLISYLRSRGLHN